MSYSNVRISIRHIPDNPNLCTTTLDHIDSRRDNFNGPDMSRKQTKQPFSFQSLEEGLGRWRGWNDGWTIRKSLQLFTLSVLHGS